MKKDILAAAKRLSADECRQVARQLLGGSTRGEPGGGMTVREAGRKGGLIGGRKGGETVKAQRGIAFYQEIGRKGGQKVRALIAAGRAALEERPPRRRG